MTASQISVILSDNSPVSQDKLKNIPNLAAKLTGVSLGDLAKDEGIFIYPDYRTKLPKDLEDGDFVLKSDNGKVCTTNVVGFLGLRGREADNTVQVFFRGSRLLFPLSFAEGAWNSNLKF